MATMMYGADLGEGEEEKGKDEGEDMEVELDESCGEGMEKGKRREREKMMRMMKTRAPSPLRSGWLLNFKAGRNGLENVCCFWGVSLFFGRKKVHTQN